MALPAARGAARAKLPVPPRRSTATTTRARHLRHVGLACGVASVLVALRQLSVPQLHGAELESMVTQRGLRVGEEARDEAGAKGRLRAAEGSVNLWRRVEGPFTPETHAPEKRLYGLGREQCFALGVPEGVQGKGMAGDGSAAAFWQMNSRAMCYMEGGGCLYGKGLAKLMTFEKRGMGRCRVVAVGEGTVVEAGDVGLNESCAAWRGRQVGSMYGQEVFYDYAKWQEWIKERKHPDPRHHAVEWESQFAIVVPKFDWSYNICHYNRIWNFIVYVIRNLSLFVPRAHEIDTIDIRFRSGFNYKEYWHRGIRNATLPALERETGKTLTVGQIRFDSLRDFQCVRRGIFLGREGRVDAFPFFNDTPVWRPEHQLDDSHWPVIPEHSLWLREVVSRANNLPPAVSYPGPLIANFTHIPVPPRRIGVLGRSPRSRRRLSADARVWWEGMLEAVCQRRGFELEYVHTSSAMTLGDQVKQVRRLGFAVGLHGANMVNSMFMPAGGGLFEIFPWRYVRYYYAGGGNAGLRYSFHEPESGIDRNCSFREKTCFMKYRESIIYLTPRDRQVIQARVERGLDHIDALHRRYPGGEVPLLRKGSMYHIER